MNNLGTKVNILSSPLKPALHTNTRCFKEFGQPVRVEAKRKTGGKGNGLQVIENQYVAGLVPKSLCATLKWMPILVQWIVKKGLELHETIDFKGHSRCPVNKFWWN